MNPCSQNPASESNIREIARLELEASNRRRPMERLLDRLAAIAAGIPWLASNVALIVGWVIWNVGAIEKLPPFDPYPFGMLGFVLTVESLILMLVILMRQNAMVRVADKRAHLDLQLNILAEQEATMTLRIVRQLCAHFGVQVEEVEQIQDLQKPTSIQAIAKGLDEHLPD